MSTQTYSVRRPGCSAWARGLTLAEADREAEVANRTCAPGHQVVPDFTPVEDASEDQIFDALWYGDDGDPADLW